MPAGECRTSSSPGSSGVLHDGSYVVDIMGYTDRQVPYVPMICFTSISTPACVMFVSRAAHVWYRNSDTSHGQGSHCSGRQVKGARDTQDSAWVTTARQVGCAHRQVYHACKWPEGPTGTGLGIMPATAATPGAAGWPPLSLKSQPKSSPDPFAWVLHLPINFFSSVLHPHHPCPCRWRAQPPDGSV
jgi:hypothetical protein